MPSGAETWLRQNHFLLRRLHSLTGIVPVGAFLIVHLFTNSLAALDAHVYDEHVRDIYKLPYLLLIEILFIFLPLAFHSAYGVVIAMEGRSNAAQYWWLDNWRYTLQRVTAWIALGFILLHLLHYRFAPLIGGPDFQETVHRGMTPFDLTQWGFVDGTPIPTWLWVALYSVGLVASVFHFCNGISTFCITWGITVGDQSRKRVFVGSMLLGLVLLAWGFASLYALTARPKPDLKLPPEPETPAVASRSYPRTDPSRARQEAVAGVTVAGADRSLIGFSYATLKLGKRRLFSPCTWSRRNRFLAGAARIIHGYPNGASPMGFALKYSERIAPRVTA